MPKNSFAYISNPTSATPHSYPVLFIMQYKLMQKYIKNIQLIELLYSESIYNHRPGKN